MRYSNPYRYSFDQPYQSVQCVFKLWFGTKYFIWKAKALHQSVNQVSVELDRKLRLGVKKDDIWAPVVNYIRRRSVALMRVEVIKQTEDAGDMLLTEFKALQEAKNDPKCLNRLMEPYVPKWITAEDRQLLDAAILESKKKKVVVKKKTVMPVKIKKNASKKKVERSKTTSSKNTKIRIARRDSR